MSKFRFIAAHPERAGKWNEIKTASYLEDVLTDLQCDADGRINYGRAFGYAWLLAHWPGNPDERPSVRTLKRHMQILKRAGIVQVRVVGFGGGMVVRMLRSAKWQNERPAPAVQLPLWLPPVASIRGGRPVDKPVEKQLESTVSQIHMGPDLSPVGGQTWPRKEVKNLAEETIRTIARSKAVPRVEKTQKQLDARRRLLQQQAEMLEKKFKNAV